MRFVVSVLSIVCVGQNFNSSAAPFSRDQDYTIPTAANELNKIER